MVALEDREVGRATEALAHSGETLALFLEGATPAEAKLDAQTADAHGAEFAIHESLSEHRKIAL
jgi:hypothetical protein